MADTTISAYRTAAAGQVPVQTWRKCDPKGAPWRPSVRAPSDAAGLVVELVLGDVVRALRDGALDGLRGDIVEGHLAAEFSDRHRIDHVTHGFGIARGR